MPTRHRSSAKDSVKMAECVAENILLDRLKVIQCADLAFLDHSDLLINVRTGEEYNSGPIPGAISIPLDELGNRLNEFPADKK